MAKIANAINVPTSSSTQSLTLGNSNNLLGTNALDCKGSAAFGTLAGTAAPANGLITAPFLGIGTATQFLAGSTAEFVMPPSSSECDVLQISYVGNNASTNGSNLIHLTARGTQTSPTANQSGDILGQWGARGYTGTAFTNSSKALITMVANENWTNTNNGTAIVFSVTMNGTTTITEIARIINTSSAATNTGLAITDLGSGLLVKEGTNARMGIVTLVLGVSFVSNTTVTANTRIFLTKRGSISGQLAVSSRTPGVGFTITSQLLADVSDVFWLLIEPSP